jgi:hypothetical protein
VSSPNRRFRKWAFWRPQGPGAEELIARAQRLVDTPRPPDGYSLEWCAEAKHVGDLTAIAITALRVPIQYPTGAHIRNGNADRKHGA